MIKMWTDDQYAPRASAHHVSGGMQDNELLKVILDTDSMFQPILATAEKPKE